MNQSILDIPINNKSEKDILEDIKKGLKTKAKFTHVVSLNPENLIISRQDKDFKETLLSAQIRINDGIGIVIASQILNNTFVPRLTGVDLMQKLVNWASIKSLRVLLIGGKGILAKELADCYNRSHPASKFWGFEGFKDVQNQSLEESRKLLSIVADLRPHLIFLAFGSPYQEKWIHKNRASLQGVTCIGVGGAFDFLSGKIRRAPSFVRAVGLEWLYRLLLQPWRLKRQLRLIQFLLLVIREKFSARGVV